MSYTVRVLTPDNIAVMRYFKAADKSFSLPMVVSRVKVDINCLVPDPSFKVECPYRAVVG